MEEGLLRQQRTFTDVCIHTTHTRRCCRNWSLPSYVMLLSNRSSCSSIQDEDVAATMSLLTECSYYYHKMMLEADCSQSTEEDHRYSHCHQVPAKCKQHDAIYHILHYITDIHFLQAGRPNSTHLQYAMTLIPVAAGSAAEAIYKNLEERSLQQGTTQIAAIHFGIKQSLFDHFLIRDSLWFSVAIIVIFLIIWLYTTSLFLTIMTILCIFLALEISYFLYTFIFKISFFPFMNLLTIVIMIGVGADDMFIYCKVWSLAKSEKNVGTLEKIISDALRHASLPMFVTSLTTAAAFYANFITNITALESFAIYAGTTIIVNFVLMITWLPAVFVIYEKWCSDCLMCYSPDIYSFSNGVYFYTCKLPYKIYYFITDWSRIFFEKLLPCVVIKLRYVWLLLFSCLSVAGIFVTFYYPKLKLPQTNEFQVFAADHPFEVYDLSIKDQFWFEKAAGIGSPSMPLTAVWGVQAADNGHHLDPNSEGNLQFDSTFDIANPDAQEWLLKFCRKLRGTDMYQVSYGPQITNCFIEQFKRFMERRCTELDVDLRPCCRSSSFPFKAEVFHECMWVYRNILSQTPELYFSTSLAGPRYSKDTGKMVALVVEFNSKQPFSFNYKEMKHFYNYMNSWMEQQLLEAPSSMQDGWFISHLDFYNLQDTLASGTQIAIGVALAVTLVMAFLTTLNLLITLYAILTIAGIIFCTIASLVLLDWQLNILESVIIGVSIGLSIDFTLHYGMAYRLSPDLDRETRVICALSRMGSPVSMAALTTFLAGALVMPSTVLAYRQLGTFLMLLMSISWLMSTLFFMALLRCAGPQGGFGQYHWPSCDCCSCDQRRVDKTVYTMSESTLSSSSTNHANSSETHELEPLTDHHRHRIRSVGVISNGDSVASKDTVISVTGSRAEVRLSCSDSPDDLSTQKLLHSPKVINNNGADIWRNQQAV